MRRWFCFCLALTAPPSILVGAGHPGDVPPRLDAATIMRRVLETAAKPHPLHYTYSRRSIREELDAKGRIQQRSERLYRVSPILGLSFPRLILKEGKPLRPAEAAAEQAREDRFRQRWQRRSTTERNQEECWITRELLQAFRFRLIRTEPVGGRLCYVLDFFPSGVSAGLGSSGRIANQLAGRVWIDLDEFQLARLQVRLLNPVDFFWGVAGELDQFRWTFEQARLGPGQWLESQSRGYAAYRKLWTRRQVGWRNETSAISRVRLRR